MRGAALKRASITSWLGEPAETDVEQVSPFYAGLLRHLNLQAPGQSSQNLLELSNHFTSAVYLAVNSLAKQCAAAEYKVFERTPDPHDGDDELTYDEPIVQLLNDPNPEDTFGDLLYSITQQVSLTGTALLWNVPGQDRLGTPEQLWVLPSALTIPLPPSPLYPKGAYRFQTIYPWTSYGIAGSAAGATIPAEQVLRIKNQHPYLRWDGYATLTAIRTQVDSIDAIDLSRLNTQLKGSDPTMSLEFDPSVVDPAKTDMVRLRNQLESLYAGPLGKKLWLNPIGTKMTRVSNTPSEMDWQGGWDQLVSFALASYGVPKTVAGLLDDVSYATLYSSLKQFYIASLNPLLNKIAGVLNKKLIIPYFGHDYYLKLEGAKIQDEELLEKQLVTDGTLRVRTRNEVRKLRGLPPDPTEAGDEYVGLGASLPMRDDAQDKDADQAEVEKGRPDNMDSGDSLPPRKSLLEAIESAKSNGHAFTNGRN